jgi:hypothetical protein
MKDKLIVCLNASKMLESSRGKKRFDIGQMVRSVPSLTILSGDPNLALSVEIDHQYAADLRQSVQGVCTVGPDTEFDLLDSAGPKAWSRLAR